MNERLDIDVERRLIDEARRLQRPPADSLALDDLRDRWHARRRRRATQTAVAAIVVCAAVMIGSTAFRAPRPIDKTAHAPVTVDWTFKSNPQSGGDAAAAVSAGGTGSVAEASLSHADGRSSAELQEHDGMMRIPLLITIPNGDAEEVVGFGYYVPEQAARVRLSDLPPVYEQAVSEALEEAEQADPLTI